MSLNSSKGEVQNSPPEKISTGIRPASALGCLLLAGIGVGTWIILTRNEPVRFGAFGDPEKSGILVIAYGYCVTLVGVTLGSLYRELQRRKAEGHETIANIPAFLRSTFQSIDFWLGLCGSPIVYALLLKSIEGGGVPALTAVGLENGFCCVIILNALIEKPTVE